MKPKKHIYFIYLATTFGIGMQPTKGDTMKDARGRYKKRFPKGKILSIEKGHTATITKAI